MSRSLNVSFGSHHVPSSMRSTAGLAGFLERPRGMIADGPAFGGNCSPVPFVTLYSTDGGRGVVLAGGRCDRVHAGADGRGVR
jgi:hypothetical protein